MSDRKKAIETLKQLRLDYEEFYEEHNNEVTHAYDMAIASLEVDEAYQLEYERTTKNDLGVDCISREQAKEAIRDKFKDLPSRVEINTILNELPSVTPQEPKIGHWVQISPAKIYECSKCGQNVMTNDIEVYRFCHGCGADMRADRSKE